MAYRINLTQKQEIRLKKIVKDNQHNTNLLKRAYCILLKNEGQKNENITRLLDIHEDTIADWSKIYLKRGLNRLLEYHYDQRRKSKLDPYRARIKRLAKKKKIQTIRQLQKAVRERLHLEVEYSWLYRYCVKYGIYNELRNKKLH